jgi:hypothetical protein
MWRLDLLLGKYLETNKTSAIAIQWHGKQQLSYCWKKCFILGPCKEVIRKTTGVTQLVESQPVKRRLRRWYEMVASLRPSQLRVGFCMGDCEVRT